MVTTSGRAVGRPARVDRGEIVAAAKRIVDDEGIDRLTMRRLAADVGTTPMALYHHVRDKDGLLLLLLDDLVASTPRPRLPADPRRRVVAAFHALHRMLTANPWVVEVLSSDDLMHREGLWYVEQILDGLAGCGLEPDDAVRAYRLVWSYTIGDVIIRANAATRREHADRPNVRDELLARSDPRTHPRVAAVADRWASLTSRDDYRRGVDAIVAGIVGSGG